VSRKSEDVSIKAHNPYPNVPIMIPVITEAKKIIHIKRCLTQNPFSLILRTINGKSIAVYISKIIDIDA
jgi:hypothetical protein